MLQIGLATIFSGPTIETTFVAADPPRASWLALWDRHGSPLGPLPLERVPLRLATPVEGGVAVKERTVVKLPLQHAIDLLFAADQADASQTNQLSPSVRAWARALSFSIALVSQGRFHPTLTSTGIDCWQLGPFGSEHAEWQLAMAQSLPVEGRAADIVQRPGHDTIQLGSSAMLLQRFTNAVADIFLRTAAAEKISGHEAFASFTPTIVDYRLQVPRLLKLLEETGPPLINLLISPLESQSKADKNDFLGSLIFQSRSNQDFSVSAKTLWAAPAEDRRRLHLAESTLIRVIKRAARVAPALKPLFDQSTPSDVKLSEQEVGEITTSTTAQRLTLAGLRPTIRSTMLSPLELTPVIEQSAQSSAVTMGNGNLAPQQLSSINLGELRWKGSLQGQELTDEELEELVNAKRTLIRLRGQWVEIDDNERKRLTKSTVLQGPEALAASLSGSITIDGNIVDVQVSGPLAKLADRLQNRDATLTLPAPTNLHAELRPYQKRGLAWLVEMDQLGLGGILADDMGLGKTVQILALHLQRQRYDPSPTLVICPASVVGNWERETRKFCPTVTVHRYHSATRSLRRVKPGELVVTTYGVARRDANAMQQVDWGLICADEAQAIKNPNSRSAQVIRSLPARTRFALTGTPIQNQLSDLWAILDWTTPGLLGPLNRFRTQTAGPIERGGDVDAANRLNQQLRPFLLRRTKADPEIAPDLPPKTQTDELVPLSQEQVVLYQAVVEETMEIIRSSQGIQRKGLVLKLLTKLKQICNHPAQFLGEDENLTGRSGKLTATTELLRVIKGSGQAALVFTQYVTMGDLLVKHLTANDFRVSFLNGSLSLNERDRLVNSFQAKEVDAFVVSLRAGGFGLNLTQASHVIHYDRWWNPAVEDQASDRAWRIGQTRPVQVHRLTCEGTIEDNIAQVLDSKRALAESVVGSGEAWISELSDDDLAALVSLSDEEVTAW